MSSNDKGNPNVALSAESVKNKEIMNEKRENLEALDDVMDCSKNADTQCGLGCGYKKSLQRFASQTSFIIAFGLIGSVISMNYAYFNGTISTLEKRFHLSSRSIGITQMGNDFTQIFTCLFFVHFVSKKHRPHWMALGAFIISFHCLMVAALHWFYGAGEDALKLTKEYGASFNENITKILNSTEDNNNLCNLHESVDECRTKIVTEAEGHPMLILFLTHALSGIGWALFYTLGYAYMDDNVEKSKTASMYSFSAFLNMLGPSCGYTIAAFCLRHYVSPSLTPIIDSKDQRWIGAWWMGWLIFSGLLFILALVIGMFPKVLPAKYKRSLCQKGSLLQSERKLHTDMKKQEITDSNSSFRELLETVKRLVQNKIYMCNNIGSIFYCFGYMPYWIFTPKYLEVVFRQSAAESNIYTGTIALVFTAVGVLSSGQLISRKKPRARILAGWNAFTGILTVVGFISYSFIGCPENENSLFLEQPKNAVGPSSFGCVDTCHCDFVPYAPVCGENNLTYISPCHAGCKGTRSTADGKKQYYDCDCVWPLGVENATLRDNFQKQYNESGHESILGGSAVPGACHIDCFKSFIIFLVIMCILKFFGSSTRASYFLIQIRCVSVEDKTVSLGFSMVMVSLLSFVPSPIFFGWVFDRMCLVWGKTCTEKSNCWLYDAKRLRYTLNYTASVFLLLGVCFDFLNCYLVKDLKVFDDDEEKAHEDKIASNKELALLGGTI